MLRDILVWKSMEHAIRKTNRRLNKLPCITRHDMRNPLRYRIIVCADDSDHVAKKVKKNLFDPGFGRNTGFGLALSRETLAINVMTIRETGKRGKCVVRDRCAK